MGSIREIICKTKNGQDYHIRTISIDDAMPLIDYAKSHAFDPLFSVITADDFSQTEEGERQWIKNLQDGEGSLGIVAELDGEVVGMLDFHQKVVKRMKHFGTFGMSVHTEYRNQGIGFNLLKTLIDWGKDNSEIDKISLGVLSTNPRAIHLYKKLGFSTEGTEKGFLKNSDGTYVDSIIMSLWVN